MDINDQGELNEEPVKESGIKYSEGSFIVDRDDCTYINVNVQFVPDGAGISPCGRFHVLYVHPRNGTCTFYVEQDDNLQWFAEVKPPFVDDNLIEWIGQQIDANFR